MQVTALITRSGTRPDGRVPFEPELDPRGAVANLRCDVRESERTLDAILQICRKVAEAKGGGDPGLLAVALSKSSFDPGQPAIAPRYPVPSQAPEHIG